MRQRHRQKIPPIVVMPGDSITLGYSDHDENGVQVGETRTVLSGEIGRAMTLDEGVVVDVEPGDFEGVSDGIGGFFLQTDRRLEQRGQQRADEGSDTGPEGQQEDAH